jgi:hypothetical protein
MKLHETIDRTNVLEDGENVGWRAIDIKVGEGCITACIIQAVH